MNKNQKTGNGGDRSSLKPKNLVNAGGISKAFDVFDNNEKPQDLQADLLAVINPEPKVRRLHRCNGCGHCFAAEKFSIFFNVCKQCLRDAKGKSKLAQSNFIERTLNNFRKNLKGAIGNV